MRLRTVVTTLFIFLLSLTFLVPKVNAYYTGMPASVVLGQVDFNRQTANQGVAVSAVGLSGPRGVLIDGNRLIVADTGNHRVLIWNQVPTSNNIAADVVIGQANFTSNSANQGGSAAANTLSSPWSIAVAGQKLIIGDLTNNRVLIYNQIPTSNNASADVVIGQPDMITVSAGTTQSKFSSPRMVSYDSATGKLLVPDASNNRVLIFNQLPTTNGANADVVVGQVNFTTGTANQGGTVAANTISGPQDARIFNNKLIVADLSNRRYTIWNQIPTSNNASADVVIGQVDFTHNTADQGGSVNGNTINTPIGMTWDGKRLFIIDTNVPARILIFNGIPTSNNAFANAVIGQTSFTATGTNQGNFALPKSTGLAFPDGVFATGSKLFVGDGSNHRVLIYNNDVTTPGLSVSAPQSVDNGLVKFTGNANTTITNYTIQNVQYMVNGGGFNGATATDGAFDTANENFFFTFDPKSNNNTNDGYTVQIKSTTTNLDTTDHLFYFQPFALNAPADRSFVSQTLPTFSFSVNKQHAQLKENLSKYQLLVKKSGGDWKTYVDNILIDTTNSNNVYDDKLAVFSFSSDNSTVTVTPKAVDDQGNPSSLTFDQSGKILSNGGYEWKVQAIDKNGHVQETETRKFVVGASSFSNGSNWFPLQINSITGLGRVYLSTISPQLVKSKYRIQTGNPIFKGIATANSTVQLDLTNQTCLTKGESNCVQTFSANTNAASQFYLATSTNTLRSGNIYQAQFSVSQNDLFNALPPFLISR